MRKRKNLRSSSSTYSSASTAKERYLPLFVLVALSLFIAGLRLHTYEEPFERDIASHAVIAHEMLGGRQLYSDLWDSKPPAIFVTYAVADALVGYGPGSVYFIGVTAAVITLLGAYWAGSARGSKIGGLWAAAFWAVICSDLWLWANQPNTEVGINACLVWAFALIVRADARSLQLRRWLVIGGLFAIATLYKPVAITFPALLGFFHLLVNFRDGQARKLAFLQVCIVAAVGAAVWAAVFAYFAATDRFAVFYDTLFRYGSYYTKSRGGNLLANVLRGFSYEVTRDRLLRYMRSTPVLAVLAGVGTILGLWRGSRRHWLLLLSFGLAAHIAIALPGRFYGHYYQLWLGPLVIGSAWAVAAVSSEDRAGPTLARYLVGAVGLIILLCTVLPQYKLSADEWSAEKQGPQYVISKKLAMELDKLLEPDETLYVWGINPEIYFWSKRRPPTGVIWSTDLVEGPLAEEHTARVLEELKRQVPEILVINRLHVKTPRNHPIITWAQGQYVPLPGNPDRGLLFVSDNKRAFLFRIFIRRGGRLATHFGV